MQAVVWCDQCRFIQKKANINLTIVWICWIFQCNDNLQRGLWKCWPCTVDSRQGRSWALIDYVLVIASTVLGDIMLKNVNFNSAFYLSTLEVPHLMYILYLFLMIFRPVEYSHNDYHIMMWIATGERYWFFLSGSSETSLSFCIQPTAGMLWKIKLQWNWKQSFSIGYPVFQTPDPKLCFQLS